MAEENVGKLERRRSKRQRVLKFFKSWKSKQPQSHSGVYLPAITHQTTPQEAQAVDLAALEQQSKPVDNGMSPAPETEQEAGPVPLEEPEKEEKVESLNEEQLRTLFAGAPHFSITKANGRCTPTVTYPWDLRTTTKDFVDSVHPVEPAFSAATLRGRLQIPQRMSEDVKQYKEYELDVVEFPSMLSAQGIESGTIGFSHFLELPKSDSLVTDLEQSQSSMDFLESSKNKEKMQANPERLGIRPVELNMIYDRLVEFQDLYEAFHDSPEPMTILNNQSSGDLYANLFTKFLTPPGYDDSTDDPTGLETQIMALLRILKLKGVWYDFSLVEWRIRLGQILWSEPEPTPEHEPHSLWTEREILLLQITLSCELLLRLDAVTMADAADPDARPQIDSKDVRGFLKTKTRKTDWDLVLARRFLDNISIGRGQDEEAPLPEKARGLLSLLSGGAQPDLPKPDPVILPQHQIRQLSGLFHFAKTIQWPSIDVVSKDLARNLGVHDSTDKTMQQDVASPSGMSVYATPLQTPLSTNHQLDSYFGHVGKPVLNRKNSRALRIPLSPTLTAPEDHSEISFNNVGGWLSRSYLTGLVLPGEAISHFLISTLLENDSYAITSLGDSANLYGGFTFAGRTFWSRTSIVGRILACAKDSAECMGWVSCSKLPEGSAERWYSIHSEQLPYENRLRVRDDSDLVSQDSAIVPGGSTVFVRSDDFVLPSDLDSAPTSSLAFSQWELMPINPDLIDDDNMSGPPTESDIHAPSMTFVTCDEAVSHTFTLTYEVQFVTSWQCTTAASVPAPAANLPKILKRSLTGTPSRSSSKRSDTLSRRNSHGFEPLLSHPPDAADIAPKRMYDADTDESDVNVTSSRPMNAHLLHRSYGHKIVPVTDILDPDFLLPFALHTSKSTDRMLALSSSHDTDEEMIKNDKKTVLVLDARASSDLDLLARAWCAEKGLHALVGRDGRTCLACCIREARGLGINIVIRV
ncbi:hypothetical protein EJ02DRAFT_457197 [Clathrospora elynae]|uniref:Uncharacterized protein n=1 Tax=Clathrospora elynae TaxID=706981 RepID=A0A6A5SET6_9PLEO|nr:hypothetical protein EJ02DRAFT_457197 [Clathrospora elynae]